jgi:hypothetical protein
MLYERLGFSRDRLDVSNHMQSLKLEMRVFEQKGSDWEMMMTAIASGSDLLAMIYYYYEDLANTRSYALMSIGFYMKHFFGSWRSEIPIGRKPASESIRKSFEPWARPYQTAVFWAACLGEWDKVKELSTYPTDECPIGRYSETKQDCYWLLALAGVLRGDGTQQEKYFKVVRKCRSKYHRQLLDMLEAILARDISIYHKALDEHLYYCVEHLFDEPRIDRKISRDGTILHHYARHLGLDVAWPKEHIDRLVSL